MVGILVVTHGKLGDVLIDTAEIIFDAKIDAIVSVSIDLKQNVETLRKKIKDGIKAVNQQKGILILTDMFGGTPSNLSYSFLEEGKIEVISGVNLPILVKAINCRKKETDLHQMAKIIEECGKKSISLASDVLKGSKRS
jgi:PTS system mannose-specific IIA component